MNLYKRNGKICRYPENDRIKVLDDKEFLNAWDYTLGYDSQKSFFENFKALSDIFPYQYLLKFFGNENAEFADAVFGGKNIYLSFVVWLWSEDIAYSAFSYGNTHNVFNSFLACKNISNCYMSAGVNNSHNIFYSRYITDSADIWFSSNLMGCTECIGCDNLQNKKYYIGNTEYQKVEYIEKKKEIMSDKKWFERYYSHVWKKGALNFSSENVEGNYIIKSSNIENGMWIANIHDSRNVLVGNGNNWSRNFYDSIDVGMDGQDFYGVMAAWWSPDTRDIYCSMQIGYGSNIYYCAFTESCNYCLGCIWLKNKSYCILNKQYTKEEWEILAEKIFASMEADGTLGEFFPASMNPFYFNDTLAYLIDDSFTKEEIEKEGFLWRDAPIKVDIPEWLEVVNSSELDKFQGFRETPLWGGDAKRSEAEGVSFGTSETNPPVSPLTGGSSTGTWHIDPSIMQKVIVDEKWNYYRIVQMEYDFLMKHVLPLPTMHWLDRIKMGFQ
jgi:hypothetical protein